MAAIAVTFEDNATPLLNELKRTLEDRVPLHKAIADRAELLTRNHLIALDKHETARRLGATPTQYFKRKGEGVESRATKDAAIVTIPTGNNAGGNPGLEAFARVFGPVVVKAQVAQWLTIPAIAPAYGRRAREWGSMLTFIPLNEATAMLARTDGGQLTPFYWLKKEVTLSQDESLLPTDDEYAEAAEQGAVDLVRELEQGGLS